jgi:hypothetical protein
VARAVLRFAAEWQGAKSESRARSATMAGQTLHALDFVRSLSEKLSVSEKQRAQEADAFAKRLYCSCFGFVGSTFPPRVSIRRLEAEQSSCDRYVEKKLLLDRITELTDHIAERDDVDRKVEVRHGARCVSPVPVPIAVTFVLSRPVFV